MKAINEKKLDEVFIRIYSVDGIKAITIEDAKDHLILVRILQKGYLIFNENIKLEEESRLLNIHLLTYIQMSIK